jgi:23S rRNA pseudouridine955/2504/2580 synthase
MIASKDGKYAVTHFKLIEKAGHEAAWVAMMPVTGRTHQLRVHMAAIGTPIVGDGKYGGKEAFLAGSISKKLHLHARSISFPHPKKVGKVAVTAPLPKHMADTWKWLDFDESGGDIPASDFGP